MDCVTKAGRWMCGFVRLAWALPALVILAASAGSGLAQQRQRFTPPEPGRAPWISAGTIQGLTAAIARYEQIAASGGWPELPGRITLRPGDSDANVAILRQRLALTGDMPPSSRNDYTFDQAVEAGVMRFQARHGLEPTGVVFGITQRSLNVPAVTRLKQLRTNLARLTDLASKVGSEAKYLVMNSASFELQGIANGRVQVTSRTIAGKRTTPTPDVAAKVQAINLLPYWHVPGTIAQAQLIPAIRKDPAYLLKERIRVFSSFGGGEVDPSSVNWWGPESTRYVFRQDPGPQNALGLLRFDMPNKHIVYMHDTPMKNLFNYFERSYSAGCVRLQSFTDVAEWVLGGQDGWTRTGIEQAIATGPAKTLKLAKPVPIYFVYLTAWIDTGVVQFRNDLYNRDEATSGGEDDAGSRQLVQSIAP